MNWEQRSWAEHSRQDPQYEVAFYREKGMLTIQGTTYAIYDPKANELSRGSGNGGNQTHLQNFVDAIREKQPLHAEIEEGYKSTLFCHLGNIAYRVGHTLQFDPQRRRIVDDKAAQELWAREYRNQWQPKI